jgi:diguanylate cyclase (GGDEF)-like protein
LSKAVVKLNEDMRDYVNAIVSAEDVAKALQSRVTKMNVIAYQDALTGVKNKAAYDKKLEALNWDILNYSAAFAIVMADLNFLKIINDRYGHDKGNEYIKGSCLIMCSVFQHSPVYRIGGDEFVAVLEGDDYHKRDELLAQIQEEFRKSASQSDLSPWQRYSAAAGMAAYRQDHDMDAEAVFERADGEMYVAKVRMKNEGAPK